ncbi:MAG: hypothetical protein QOE07_236 [Acidimicrobiaceae bacterium]|jgi:hypothetical protein|nr:hypothetical protein [Acidimicrobiaceae bacterium]
MAAQIGCSCRHDHYVSRLRRNVLLAAGTDVGLASLKGVNSADLHRVRQRGISAHSSNPATTASATATMT